jgi:hypothetical protein
MSVFQNGGSSSYIDEAVVEEHAEDGRAHALSAAMADAIPARTMPCTFGHFLL